MVQEDTQEPDAAEGRPADESANGQPRKHLWWGCSAAVSLILMLVLVGLWTVGHRIQINTVQLFDQEAVDSFLAENWAAGDRSDAVRLPVGVFVQSIQLLDSSDVHVSLYIWQRRTDGIHDQIGKGFILPEQVDSRVPPRREYEIRDGDDVIIGTYFEGVLRQAFDFDDYPFDEKTIWIRIWPENFDENVVLAPDFQSYPCPYHPDQLCTGVNDEFGIEESIQLGEFTRETTYFDYQISDYTTNFGIDGNVRQTGFPELRFNIVLKRIVVSAFIIHMVPLVVVAVLAFALLMATTHEERGARRLGFSSLTVTATVAALAFVILLAQVQMRQNFASSGFVYLELIYFVMYVMLLLVVVNAYAVNSPTLSNSWLVHYGDNLIAKTSYWPVLLGLTVLVTIFRLS